MITALNLTTEQIVTISASVIGAVFLGLGQLLQIWLTRSVAIKSDANRAATAAQLAPIAVGVAVTEAHTNSEKTRAQGELSAVEKENALLREMMAKMDADKALLAQAVAQAQAPAAAIAPIAATASLHNIDGATAETAANTRATERKVDALKEK